MAEEYHSSRHPSGLSPAGTNEASPALTEGAYRKAVEMTNLIKTQGVASSSALKTHWLQVREEVQDVAHSKSGSDVRERLTRVLRTLASGPVARTVARALICCYYINIVYAHYEMWTHLNTYDKAKAQRRRTGDPVVVVSFPYWEIFGVLPSALLTLVGFWVPISSVVLLGEELHQNGRFAALQLYSIVRYGSRPTEVLMQHIAMLGSTLLILIYALKDSPSVRSIAGPLISDKEENKPGKWRSFASMLARLLMAGLFLFVGYNQVLRLQARDMAWKPTGTQHYGVRDARDNDFLLLECLLAVPLIIGFKTEAVSSVLAAVLVTEALAVWQFWAQHWPSWSYRAMVRDHFFVNLAAAGGLLHLHSFGAGLFTVDELLKGKAD